MVAQLIRSWLARVRSHPLAVALLMIFAVLAIVGAKAPWSESGWSVLMTGVVLASAWLFERPLPRRILRLVAGGLLVALVAMRLVGTARAQTRVITLPGGAPSRLATRLFDEQDVSLLGARILPWVWRLPADEREQLLPAMREAYVEMRKEGGSAPSPVIDTLLHRQNPSAFDTLVIEPPGVARANVGVVVLHGYAGSFSLECWLVASAARAIGAVTVCPATDSAGHWSGRDGERTLRTTLDYLHARGVERVYLAGLSNGAVGAGVLASRFRSSLVGLIVISGAPSTGGSGLPTLIVQGERDTMSHAASARAFAARAHATYAGFDAGHFVLLVRRKQTREAIAAWLRRHEPPPAPSP